jgi:nitrate reductase NapE component
VEPDVRDEAQAPSDIATAGSPDVSQRSGRRPTLLPRARQSSPAPQAPGVSPKGRRNPRVAIFKVLKRLWIPLVILAVIGAGGFTVSRLHGVFGSEKRASYADTRIGEGKPFNPKHLTYEVFGPPGTVATISYFDVNGDPQHVDGVLLPWSYDISTTLPALMGSIVAQGDSDSIGCRIVVDGVVKAQNSTNEINAFTYCMLKAA